MMSRDYGKYGIWHFKELDPYKGSMDIVSCVTTVTILLYLSLPSPTSIMSVKYKYNVVLRKY